MMRWPVFICEGSKRESRDEGKEPAGYGRNRKGKRDKIARATLRREWSHFLYAAHGIQEYRAFASMLVRMNAEEKTPAA